VSSSDRAFALLLAALGAIATVGCGGTTVSLGDSVPPLFHFGPARPLTELDTSYANENPTLTGDLLELWFNSNRGPNNGDVWMARRASAQEPFAAPQLIDAVSSPMHETSPAISLDGLTIYFGSDRPGGLGDFDIWRAIRPSRTSPWATAEDVGALNTPTKDVPSPVGQHDLVMPLSSERDSIGAYQTYLSSRPSADTPFGAPVLIPELTFPDRTTVDAFLSDDGLVLFYSFAAIGAKADIYVAWRKTDTQPFSVAVPIPDVDTAAEERDPWLSPDGTVFYFTSDRGAGVLQIYEAAASRGPSAGR
jgi:hypothetical protein